MALSRKSRPIESPGPLSGSTTIERRRKSDKQWVTTYSSKLQDQYPLQHGSQVTDSEGHPWPPKTSVTGDVGGEFQSVRYYVSGQNRRLKSTLGPDPYVQGSYDAYRSRFDYDARTPIETYGSGDNRRPQWPTSLQSSKSTLEAKGATAVSRCRPTAGETELSTSLGELYKDGLPSLVGASSWEKRTSAAKKVAGEHLNVEFGWKPLVSEVQSLARSIADHNRILEQYERDRGRLVRRSYTFPIERSTSRTLLATNRQPLGVYGGIWGGHSGLTQGGEWWRTTTTYKRTWFKGAFVYGTPLPDGLVGNALDLAQKVDRIYGIAPTPDVLWELTPWSWATDWALNTGDILNYASDVVTHGLVMRYGYIMEHTIHKHRYTLTPAYYHGQRLEVAPVDVVCETKRRLRANPFGFGITWDGLSAAQTAILAAVGISRS